MKTFKINEKIEIVCESEKTRYGFRHLAYLIVNNNEVAKGKCCYYNRTWESYEFQSVMYQVIRVAEKSKVLSVEEIEFCKEYIKNYNERNSSFGIISQIAMLGEVFCDNQKSKNDWKLRMIKAGLENKGLSVPEDWDTLSEEEKEKRLNLVIGELEK